MISCQTCGRQMDKNDRFCNACGTLAGAKPPSIQNYANPAYVGQMPTSRKSKAVSILLAMFLTYWTWLYTYKRDGWKFWLGLILSGLPLITATIFMEFYISNVSWLSDQVLIDLSYALPIVIWLFAIIDTARKKQAWYDYY